MKAFLLWTLFSRNNNNVPIPGLSCRQKFEFELLTPVCVCVRKLTQLKVIPLGAQLHNSTAERGTLIEWELFLGDHKLRI